MNTILSVLKRKSYIIFLIFLPLQIVILFHSCASSRYIQKTRRLDEFYTSLFAGEEPSAESLKFYRGLSGSDIREYEQNWSSPRREAARYLLAWKGYRSGRVRFPEQEVRMPAAGAGSSLIEAAEAAVAQREYDKAEGLYRESWLSCGDDLPDAAFYTYSLRRAVAGSGKTGAWITLLEERHDTDAPDAEEAFFRAWCLEELGRNEEALDWYKTARRRAMGEDDRRRYLWYLFRLVIREFPSELVRSLEDAGRLEDGDGYYNDIFDDYYSVLVRGRRWKELAALVPVLRKAGLEEAAEQGLFLLMRLPEGSYEITEDLKLCFEAFSPDPRGYYSLRSYPSLWPVVSGEAGAAGPGPDSDEFYACLIGAGYTEEAFRLWQERRDGLSMVRIGEFCSWLEQEDRLYDLISFAGYWYYRLPSSDVLALMSRVYPGANRYRLPETGLPEELLLGVIRRESAFDASISSHAGAVGLMQLMPSTAADVARRNRLDQWDLQNPEDNILLGSLYLQWLKERPWSSSFVDVLAAYNGGGGNLRYWKRTLPAGDPDLFIQSIPYRETRDYIRKVIVAAASYRYLETGSPPGEWLDQFYRPF